VNMPTGQIDRRTDGRQTVTLHFPLNAASIIAVYKKAKVHSFENVVTFSVGKVIFIKYIYCVTVTSYKLAKVTCYSYILK